MIAIIRARLGEQSTLTGIGLFLNAVMLGAVLLNVGMGKIAEHLQNAVAVATQLALLVPAIMALVMLAKGYMPEPAPSPKLGGPADSTHSGEGGMTLPPKV